MSDKNFWEGRWKRGETGWHQSEVEHSLTANFSDLAPTRVFVPLCGKSLDMLWLARQGHLVLGVELIEEGCVAFFRENDLAYEVSREGKFQVFRGGAITIYQGDFFDLEPEQLGRIGAVYDRAALIALPPEVRPQYASRIKELVRASAQPGAFRFLQITLEREPHDPQGPPFSVPTREVEALYRDAFDVKVLSRDPVDARGPAGSKAFENVISLTRR